MPATKTQRFMLYSLGTWYEKANEKICDRPLKVAISKSLFVNLVLNSEIAEKRERAIYKNLETLEEKRLIKYDNKEIELTEKGEQLFRKIKSELEPYFQVEKKLSEKTPTSYIKKVQTVFKN